MEWLLLFLIGAVAGLLAGMLGVGGGLVIVPLLLLLYQAQAMAPEVMMHVAVGTSLATIIITSLSSVRAHHRRGAIDWPLFWRFAPAIIIGSLLGAVVARYLSGEWLQRLFAAFLFLVATQMAFVRGVAAHRNLPGHLGISLVAVVIGTISAMVGVGGGTMTVPYLTYHNVVVQRAVATSSAIGLPIAISGTLGFIISGWGVALRPEWSLGYVHLPAFLGIVVVSSLFAPLGARLAHTMSTTVLKRIFAVFVYLVGLKLLLG